MTAQPALGLSPALSVPFVHSVRAFPVGYAVAFLETRTRTTSNCKVADKITSLRKTHLFRGHRIVAVSTARLADGYPWTEIKSDAAQFCKHVSNGADFRRHHMIHISTCHNLHNNRLHPNLCPSSHTRHGISQAMIRSRLSRSMLESPG
jgi:hypothetical protein